MNVAGGVRVVLSGEIDLSCQERLDAAFAAVAAAMPGDVVVDVSAVLFLGSIGVQFLMELRRLVDQHHCVLTLHNPRPTVVRVVELVGMRDLLTVTHG